MRSDRSLGLAPARGFVLVALLFAACGGANETAPRPGSGSGATKAGAAGSGAAPAGSTAAAPRDVRTTSAVTRPWDRTLRVTGELAAYDVATISTEVAGRLEELTFDVGSSVPAGALLARIEARDFELERARIVAELHAARARLGLPPEGDDDRVDVARTPLVEQAESALANALKQRDRLLEALRSGAATQSDADNAITAVENATARKAEAVEEMAARRALVAQRRAEIAIADKELEDTRILAPFAGVFRDRRVAVGDFLAAGQVLATLVRVDPVRVRVNVPEFEVPRVQLGRALTFTVSGDTTARTTKLVRVEPTLDTRNRTLVFEADVPNPDGALKPGAFVTGSILLEPDTSALSVPKSAVTSFAGVDKVILVVDGKALERRVVLGRIDEKDVEITSGLVAGDVVVLEPGNLQTGAPVRVVDAK